MKSFKVYEVQQGVEAIFARYKDKLMEDVDLPMTVEGLTIGAKPDDDTSTEADSTLFIDVKEANIALAELDSDTPAAVELDGERPLAGLCAVSKLSELRGGGTTQEWHELESWSMRTLTRFHNAENL